MSGSSNSFVVDEFYYKDSIEQYQRITTAKYDDASYITKFLYAQRYLEGTEFIKQVGLDPKGNLTFLIFGSKFQN